MSSYQQEISQITRLMEMYRIDKEELPPIGDNCSGCAEPSCSSSWTAVIDALVNEGYLEASLKTELYTDAWGGYYCYDDNDNVCCGPTSPVYSMGPNKINESRSGWNYCPAKFSGDDFGITLYYGDRPCP